MMPTAPDDTDASVRANLSLSLAVTGLRDQLAQAHQQQQRAASNAPIYAPRQRAGTVAADGTLTLDLGGPAMGRRWVLRSIAICDAGAVRTAATGTADLYVGNPSAFGPASWRWPFDTLPAAQKFSDDEVLVIPHDHLLIRVQGATAGQVLMARASVLDYPITRSTPVVNL